MTFDTRLLTKKQRALAEEYVLDLNIPQAALRAGYAESTALHSGGPADTLQLPHVAAYVDHLMAERARRLHITQDEVLTRLWVIATADVNELVQYRRMCCRYCYGTNHRYQWTDAEFERACEEAKNRGFSPPEAPGGAGYDRTKPPVADCDECHGEGTGEVHALDTRNASKTARMLFAGAKVGRDGLEIKLHDQMKALELVYRHIGMGKQQVEHSGKIDGAPTLNLTLTGAAPAVKPAEPTDGDATS